MKHLSRNAAFAALMVAASASSASAQGMYPYGMWNDDAPRAYRAPPPPLPPMYQDDAYAPGYRYERREPLPWNGRRPRAAEYDYGGYYDDGYDGFDEPPPQRGYDAYTYGEENQPLDGETFDGGARPQITPIAPPRVAFYGQFVSGSIIIDVGARKLYYVNGDATAFAYPIGVGRQGFSWTGTEKIARIADWPDWYPPKEMRARKPELPAKMTGGLNNPLGARAIYLGNSLYRVHGTNDPKSIGRAESSGCFRMMNEHVAHLASIAQVGASVTVVKSLGTGVASAGRPVR